MFDHRLVLKLFEGFSIERWNDMVRPFELIEMDRAAEKAVLAYMLGKFEEGQGVYIDWDRIIWGCVFDLMRKIALCDIKAPVQRMIREEYPEEMIKLDHWVIDQYRPLITDPNLLEEFSSHVLSVPCRSDPTWQVLRAAHKYSGLREVEMLRPVNETFRLVDVDASMDRDLEGFLSLKGIQLLISRQQPWKFLVAVEKLRFQTRWNQTPRVPRTSVLGHSFFVAALTLLMGRDLDLCPRRRYNNFFSALFHDLPEAVTRDIISPVKQATDHLPHIVKLIEDRIVEHELVPLMDPLFRDEILYFTEKEFSNRYRDASGAIVEADFDELCRTHNTAADEPVDGALVRAADHISAFVEADCSIRYGISSNHLREGRANILKRYPQGDRVNGIDVAALLAGFTQEQ